MMKKTIVRLYTNNTYPGSITSNIKPTVRRKITTPKIIAALRNILIGMRQHSIWWIGTYSLQYIKRHKRKSIQFTHKYVNKLLPIGERMNKQNYNDLQKCCSCGKEVETDDHSLQCDKRPGFQNKIITALGRLKNGMYKTLYKVFEYYVLEFIIPKSNNRWTLNCFFQRHPTISNIPHYKEYTKLLLQQQKIG